MKGTLFTILLLMVTVVFCGCDEIISNDSNLVEIVECNLSTCWNAGEGFNWEEYCYDGFSKDIPVE